MEALQLNRVVPKLSNSQNLHFLRFFFENNLAHALETLFSLCQSDFRLNRFELSSLLKLNFCKFKPVEHALVEFGGAAELLSELVLVFMALVDCEVDLD